MCGDPVRSHTLPRIAKPAAALLAYATVSLLLIN